MIRSSSLIFWLASIALVGCAAHTSTPAPPQMLAQRTCAGLSDAAQQTPLLDASQVVGVHKLEYRDGNLVHWRPAGADVRILAKEGQTAPWLHRVARCQQARALAGLDASGAGSPLAVAGAKISVRQADGTFAIRIEADGRAEGREIQQRTDAWAAAHQQPDLAAQR